MYLSKCIINGFKSFADKVEISFNQGLSAVVGPNGCGKSNIYEAIMWVLGEQRPRSLRSSKMEDVIFAGSSSRSEVGMAEVVIVLTDPERNLMETAEVQITRRLFRSGKSEYFINGNSCRLKDITKILASTGVSKNSYAFIGQGKVEEVLQARPHELRLLFEEAAGIAQYKQQKFATEAQLTKTADSITRIEDLISELQTDVDNLTVRAEKAIKHQELSSKLTAENKRLLISQYIVSQAKLDSIQEKLKTLQLDLTANSIEQENINNAIALCQTRIQELQESKNETEKDLIRLDNTVQNYKNRAEELSDILKNTRGQAAVKIHEREELARNRSQIDNDIGLMKDTIKNLHQDLGSNNQQLTAVRKKIEDLKLQTNQYDIDGLEKEKSASEQKIGSLRQRSADIEERLSSAKSRLEQLCDRYSTIADNKEQELLNLTALKDKLESYYSENCNLLAEHEQLKKSVAGMTEQQKVLAKEKSALEDQRRNEISQLTLLEKMHSEYTGYYTGVKSVLLAKKADPRRYEPIIGVVAELINVPEQLQIAVSAVLGGQAQYLVSRTARDATRVISMLKEKKAGKATFLPLNRIVPRYNTIPHKVLNNRDYLGRGIDLVEYHKEAEIAVKYLLNNVLIVKTVEAALELSKLQLKQFLLVTLSGEVFSGKGLISGGKNKRDHNTELLARKKRIDSLQEQLKTTETLLLKKTAELEQSTNRYQNTITELELNQNRLSAAASDISDYEKKEFFCQTTINKISAESAELDLNIKELEQSIDTYQKLSLENKELIISGNGLLTNSSEELEKARKLIGELQQSTQLATSLCSEIRLIETNISNSHDNLENLKKSKDRVERQFEKVVSEETDLEKTISKLQQDYDLNQHSLQQWSGKLAKLSDNLQTVTTEYLRATEEQVKNNEQITALRMSEDQLNRNILRNDRKLVEQETIHKFADAELYQAGIAPDECVSETTVTSRVVEQLKIKVNQLKNLISSLGDVDYGAIADLKRRQERIGFFDQQKTDLEKTKTKLIEIISNVDKICYERLAETIEQVSDNFKESYTELFQGGNADIHWDIDEDIFSSGIVLTVSPPGKKVQYMDQLSGGEKSLTAIALLLAFTKLKSSSFCIFDEVDAALDESNNIRLANYWQVISKNTQVIAITHSRHTMVHADYLFGVVMQEKGVSKVISVALDK